MSQNINTMIFEILPVVWLSMSITVGQWVDISRPSQDTI